MAVSISKALQPDKSLIHYFYLIILISNHFTIYLFIIQLIININITYSSLYFNKISAKIGFITYLGVLQSMDRKSLGEKIRQERIRMNFTQEQLAEAVGLSTTYIGLVEHGQRAVTLEKLIDLANIFHVSIDYLLTESVESSEDADFALLKSLWMQSSQPARMLLLDIAKSIVFRLNPKP